MNAELMPSELHAGASRGRPALPRGWWDGVLSDLRIGEGTLGLGMAAQAYAAVPTSVGAARRFVSHSLTEWGMTEVAENLCLIVSELVGNACRHAVAGRVPEETRVLVQLRPLPSVDAVACMVADPEPRGPMRVSAHQFAESGRGLGLVAAFAREWGWNPVEGHGKVVWAECGPEQL
ncbi:ATP-binding protein [Nocardiopsis sp. MG754419]|uniref:ATP-binding protein n=1 Tax=Nocardiopsis sp. MG754419 TaxID=2259865 RepID=UPI001BA9D86A|nr:ATP-binding protein [Nocardiopsis sp. MG754419]MBR8742663.1 ATP-binding protein [Nocardiopsis sp. MG754419]